MGCELLNYSNKKHGISFLFPSSSSFLFFIYFIYFLCWSAWQGCRKWMRWMTVVDGGWRGLICDDRVIVVTFSSTPAVTCLLYLAFINRRLPPFFYGINQFRKLSGSQHWRIWVMRNLVEAFSLVPSLVGVHLIM